MRFEEYRKHDAVSLAELIAKRRVSAAEVLETAIARAEQVNPAINANSMSRRARRSQRGLPKGPLSRVGVGFGAIFAHTPLRTGP